MVEVFQKLSNLSYDLILTDIDQTQIENNQTVEKKIRNKILYHSCNLNSQEQRKIFKMGK